MTFTATGRRALLVVALLVLLWSLALAVTGGFAIDTGLRLISSRNAVRPLQWGLALLVLYLIAWRRQWREDLGRFSTPAPWPRLIATVATLVALVLGFGWGTRIGAGPDQSGYVSQAAMFARGALTMPAPAWSRNAPWDDAAYSASPIGWRPTSQTHILAPTYSPGLPMIMAVFTRAGGSEAAYYAVPLFGALLILSTYLLGERLTGRWAGAMAAALAISSPTFLYMQQQVMSDVPVAALLTASLVAALPRARPWLAGIAAGLAVLVRPNLVPLTLFPLLLLVLEPGAWIRRAIVFAIPVGLASMTIGTLNWYYYGSPLLSGYGQLTNFYTLASIRPNLTLYSRWMFSTHTPLIVLGFFAPLVANGDWRQRARVVAITLALPVTVLSFYLPYLVFNDNDWGYTRFLLPGYPALFVGFGVVITATVERARTPNRMAVAALAVVGFIAVHGWSYCVRTGVFMQRIGDARFASAVRYARQLPERSIFISNAHSGTLRFYTGRDVIRFEAIRTWEFDTALDYLRRQGYHLFLIGDEFEIEQFRTLFARTAAVAKMPKKPRAAFDGVAVYQLDS